MNDREVQDIPTPEDNKVQSENTIERFLLILEILWRYRRSIVKNVLIVTILFVILIFIVPKKYIASTTILPDVELMNLAQKLGGLQDIASSVGINMGVTSPSQLYPDILVSETILEKVIYHKYKTVQYDSLVNLIQYWDYDDEKLNLNYERCLEKLRKKIISITVDRKTTVITLEVETTDPNLSADIANLITSELDIYQRNFRKTNASEQRKFLEQRMGEVKSDLIKSEESLKNFREKNRKVEQSPQLLLEQARFEREIELNSAVFIELKKQYELAKLDEVKNTTVVQILDNARPPAQKSGPKRLLLTLFVLFTSTVFISTWYVSRSNLEKSSAWLRLNRLLLEARADIVSTVFRKNRESK